MNHQDLHQSQGLVHAGDIIILIHGTFAREAEWIKSDSDLARALMKQFSQSTVLPFKWTGYNSHAARLNAGQELAEYIKRLAQHSPAARFHLIGHSHGGNVAAYACSDSNVGRKVSSVSFLGTPFFHVSVKNIMPFAYAFGMIVCFALILVLVQFGGNSISVFFALLAAAVVGPLAWVRYTFYKPIIPKYFVDRQQYALDRFTLPAVSAPVFIAAVSLDEARTWLRFLNVSSALSWFVWSVARKSFALIVIVMFVAAGYEDITGRQMIRGDSLAIELGGLIFGLFIFLPAFALVMSLGLRGSPLGFGWEGFLTSLLIRIAPSAVPPWPRHHRSHVHFMKAAPLAAGLRHSQFYANLDLIRDLIRWLSKNDNFNVFDQLAVPDRSKSLSWMIAIGIFSIFLILVVSGHLG